MFDATVANAVKDWATAIALMSAGVWALWRWSYGEILRRRREMAQPDGVLSVTSVDVDQERVIATLHALWRNRGPLPIVLCPDDSLVHVYRLTPPAGVGAIKIDDPSLSTQVAEVPPWWRTYVIEPNTESLLQEHFVLQRGQVYAFRWRICLAPGALPGPYADRHLLVLRDLVWQAPAIADAVVTRAEPHLVVRADSPATSASSPAPPASPPAAS